MTDLIYKYDGDALYVPIAYFSYGNMWGGAWNDPLVYLKIRDLI